MSLAGLSRHETARSGVAYGIAGMAVALVATVVMVAESVSAGAVALLGHHGAEARLVHGDAGLLGDLQGQLDREAVGVVQLEGVRAGDAAARGAGLADRGEIAPGLRGDLVRVRELDAQPVVRAVYVGGERVA